MAYLGNNRHLTHFLLSAFLPSQPTTSGDRIAPVKLSPQCIYLLRSRIVFPLLLPIFSADMVDLSA